MDNIVKLIRQYEEARKEEIRLRQARNNAKYVIPYDGYYQKEGVEARRKNNTLYSEWQDKAEEVENLETRLKELGYFD